VRLFAHGRESPTRQRKMRSVAAGLVRRAALADIRFTAGSRPLCLSVGRASRAGAASRALRRRRDTNRGAHLRAIPLLPAPLLSDRRPVLPARYMKIWGMNRLGALESWKLKVRRRV